MHACRKHLQEAVDHEMSGSDIGQVKIRALRNSKYEVNHCDTCDAVATYHVVTINFA